MKRIIQLWQSVSILAKSSIQILISILLFSLMLITVIDVVGRYIFDMPLLGSVELTELILGAIIFCCLPLISWDKEHINVDILENWLPLFFISIRNFVFNLFISIWLFYISIKIFDLANRAYEYEEVTTYLEIPTFFFIYVLGVSCILTGITHLVLSLFCLKYKNNQDLRSI